MNLEDLFNQEAIQLKHGWNIENAPKIKTYLEQDTDYLYFGGEVEAKADYFTETESGDFQAGLWKKDVLELFIKDSESNSYQEINLAPNGAYWTGLFSNYRVEDNDNLKNLRPVEINSEINEENWKVAIKLKLNDLSVIIGKFNITAIVNNPRIFLSYKAISSKNPDFHYWLKQLTD